jgi:hypothetical protein
MTGQIDFKKEASLSPHPLPTGKTSYVTAHRRVTVSRADDLSPPAPLRRAWRLSGSIFACPAFGGSARTTPT